MDQRVLAIALHRYALDPARLDALARLQARNVRRRRMVDPAGEGVKIRRSPDDTLLLHAYVTRRIVCAGRLLQAFARLHAEAAQQPIAGRPTAALRLAVGQTAVQLTTAVGRRGYDTACHTAPCQLHVEGCFPWTWARAQTLKRDFVAGFADIYVMPQTINDYDKEMDRGSIGNAGLFLDAASLVLRDGADPLSTLEGYAQALHARFVAWEEYEKHADGWLLSNYAAALKAAAASASKALAEEAALRSPS